MIRIIIGPPCSGKTTFVRDNAATGDVVLDWDKLADAVNATGEKPEGEQPDAVRAFATYGRVVLARWAVKTYETEQTVWLIASGKNQSLPIEDYVAAGGRVTVLDPGKDVCVQRCEDDGRGEGTRAAIDAWYEEPPTIPEAWLYDERKAVKNMKAKTIETRVKAAAGEKASNPFGGDLADGDFIAYASTFHNDPDAYGDIIAEGAFTKSLLAWREKDAPIPLLFGHRMDDPAFNIGHIVDAKEDETGLLVWGRIDLETEKGQQAYRLIKSRRLTELSFAFDAVDYEENEHGGFLLKEIDLFEVSLVQLGANRHTSVLAVKSAADVVQTVKGDFTADEVDSLHDAAENLREALAEIERLLATTSENQQDDDREPETAAAPDTGAASVNPAAATLTLALALAN